MTMTTQSHPFLHFQGPVMKNMTSACADWSFGSNVDWLVFMFYGVKVTKFPMLKIQQKYFTEFAFGFK